MLLPQRRHRQIWQLRVVLCRRRLEYSAIGSSPPPQPRVLRHSRKVDGGHGDGDAAAESSVAMTESSDLLLCRSLVPVLIVAICCVVRRLELRCHPDPARSSHLRRPQARSRHHLPCHLRGRVPSSSSSPAPIVIFSTAVVSGVRTSAAVLAQSRTTLPSSAPTVGSRCPATAHKRSRRTCALDWWTRRTSRPASGCVRRRGEIEEEGGRS